MPHRNRASLSSALLLVLTASACALEAGPDARMDLRPDQEEASRRGDGRQPVLEPAREHEAAPPSVASGASLSPLVNSVDTLVDDMRLMNDLPLAGVPSGPGWASGPGFVIMGNDPRGTRTPSWWNPANGSYKSGAYWNVVLPWLVVFDGVGSPATNTRVEMRDLRVYVKSRANGTWKMVGAPASVDGELYPKHLQGESTSPPDVRAAAGVTSLKPPGGDLVFHGWGTKSAIEAPDVGCLFVTVQARLAVSDPKAIDDRAQAKYLIHVGADYYPDAATSISAFAPASYNPGAGVSRAKLVTGEWRAFNFVTIDVAAQDPGGASISEAELRASPPPLR